MAFKKRLRAYRIAQKLSYEELALLCNVTPWTIRRWELGLGKANEEQMAKLIKLLHIPEEIETASLHWQNGWMSQPPPDRHTRPQPS